MKMIAKIAAVGALTLLAACGTNERDRTTGGAAAGAATGAGIGAFGGPVGAAVGAVVGGGAGAITGATTKPSDVNLGKPVWNNPDTRVSRPERRSCAGDRADHEELLIALADRPARPRAAACRRVAAQADPATYAFRLSTSCSCCMIRALTMSPIETMPISTPSSSTGRCRKRPAVIIVIASVDRRLRRRGLYRPRHQLAGRHLQRVRAVRGERMHDVALADDPERADPPHPARPPRRCGGRRACRATSETSVVGRTAATS